MNKIFLPVMILLGSLLYSWFWNCFRKPECSNSEPLSVEQSLAPPTLEDSTKKIPSAEELVLFEPLDVYFERGQSSINKSEEIDNWLSTAKTYLEKNPNEKLIITGYSDSDGSDALNLELSIKRAEIVKNILSKEGFSLANLDIEGKGETEPLVANDTPENKAKNRRVSISLLKKI